MATERDLIAAICANPDEDTPRLAYADWLDENADELPGRDPQEVRDRAAFIRFQIAEENDPPEPSSWDESQERLRLARLPENYNYSAVWMPPLFSKVCRKFYRGFVESISCDAAEFAALAPEAFAVAPIRRLTVHGWPVTAGLATLGACPHIGRIRYLGFAGTYGAADLVGLCQSPHLHGMIELNASPQDFRDETAVALAACGGLNGLRVLRLAHGLGLAGVKAIADSPHFDRLRTLEMGSREIGDDGARALAGAARFRSSLKELCLRSCGIGEAGVVALTASADLGPLTYLELGNNSIGVAGAAALGRCERLRSVRTLNLGSCHIGDAGAARLGASDVFAGVRNLGLGANDLGPAGIRALFAGGAFRRLWDFHLNSNELGDGGAAALAAAPLDEVRSLDVGICEIGDAGAVALANSPRLRNLRELQLHNNRIGNAGARALLNSPHLTRLETLNLGENDIDYDIQMELNAKFGDINPRLF